MKGFFAGAGWVLLGVFLFVVACVFGYYGFVDLAKSSWGGAIASFVGAVVFFAFGVSAFRQARTQ